MIAPTHTFPSFSPELVAVVADVLHGKGDPLTTTELGAILRALEDHQAVIEALDLAPVRAASPAQEGKPPAATYTPAQRVAVLAGDRARAEATAEHLRESLKAALTRLEGIEAGPKGAAWASLEGKATAAQAMADALAMQVADLEATEKKLRERLALLEPVHPVPEEPPDLMPPPPPPERCPRGLCCSKKPGHDGDCDELDLPF